MSAVLLRKIPLFRGLDEEQLSSIAACVREEAAPAGTTLFSCGDLADSFYVLASGKVRIHVPASPVADARDASLVEGDFFGEMGILRDRRRMADAEVESDARLLRVDRGEFEKLLAENAPLNEAVTRTFRQRMAAYQATADATAEALKEPRRLTFLSAGGRPGCSFVCANLGAKVTGLTGSQAVAVDLNFGNPGLARYLGALSDFGSFSQIFDGDPITPEKIRKAAADLGHDVDLLAGSGTGSIALAPAHMAELLPRLTEAYAYALIDAGEGRSHLDEEVVRFSDVVHVVLEPTEESLGRAKDLVHALRTLGMEGRIRAIVNKVPPRPEVRGDRIEGELEVEILGVISDSDLQHKMGNKPAIPVSLRYPRSEVAAEITHLARAVVSQPQGPLAQVAGFLRALFFGGG